MITVRLLVRDLAVELRRRSRNAARRNKPTMWAYYAAMADWLETLDRHDDEAMLVILRGYASVDPIEMTVEPLNAGRRWAQGVYARRVLRALGEPVAKPSLAWLRERAA